VIGDADGVAVVPYGRIAQTLQAVHAVVSKEEHALASIAEGGSLSSIYGVPEVELIKSEI
jgi:regulator of RNase E activity RraA